MLEYFRKPLKHLAFKEDGEVTWHSIVVVLILIVAWEVYPSAFLGFFHFVSSSINNSLDTAAKTHKLPKNAPLSQIANHTPSQTTTKKSKTTTSSSANAHHKNKHPHTGQK